MTPDEIVSKFSVALDNFEPITDQLSGSDLTRLREAIAPLLLKIPYDETGGVHNLIGIVRAKPAYLKRYGEAFPKPTRVGAYDPKIDDDAKAVVNLGVVCPNSCGFGEGLAVAFKVCRLRPDDTNKVVYSVRRHTGSVTVAGQ